MKKELDHFYVGNSYGGNQDWFSEMWMKKGGCGAVTACDVCIYLARYKDMRELYPFDPYNVTVSDYIRFGESMRKYLGPRMRGIDRTDIFTDGFNGYLKDRGLSPIRFDDYSGEGDPGTAATLIKDRIDDGFPVPYLMLMHRDRKLNDYMWHWFILNGYDEAETEFKVKVVTYGKGIWMDLYHLWQTGRREKGGFVTIYPSETERRYVVSREAAI